jgi:hypothetical protein
MRRFIAIGVFIVLLSPRTVSARESERDAGGTDATRITRSVMSFLRQFVPAKNPSKKKSGPSSQGDWLGPPRP